MKKPNFSGTWKYNPDKSDLQIPPFDSSSFVIEHHEPCFQMTRTHVIGGKTDTLTVVLTTDGSPNVLHHGGLEIHSTLHWEEDMLVFVSSFMREGSEATNTVRYRLEPDCRTLVAEERLRSSRIHYDNIWVLDKQ